MAKDRQLARNFALREFPCYEHASELEVQRLSSTVARVLQPVRDAFGPVIPTSWMRWRSGCVPRSGSHAQGGTVDFVVPGASLPDVFSWGVRHLLPGGFGGRWIYEPERPAEEGQRQGEHIHMAPRADMLHAFGDGRILALVETGEGVYIPGPGDFPEDDVITAGGGAAGWLLAAAVLGGLARRKRGE